ncbi:hypothetical protein G7068_08335 [Leucobacter viscericola]|uniref:Uncharacterized protein n=1 Tax=Leucobacter viscericola TaxID=2714935 RepID=A0A6G7XF76_9MICO|nr:hypothetical protein [Leucobacter viscericola]QIK63203.1 hypothetical protein G7068_08335 [Leucobacter viscericola]
MQESMLMGEPNIRLAEKAERVSKAAGVKEYRRGLSLADVERGERPHRCGRCMNPFLRAGNPECPRLARQVKREQYALWLLTDDGQFGDDGDPDGLQDVTEEEGE